MQPRGHGLAHPLPPAAHFLLQGVVVRPIFKTAISILYEIVVQSVM